MVRPNLYVGSKVVVWKKASEWDDDVVQYMIPQTAILFERDRETLSQDGWDDQYGVLFLNADGTASHFQWWVEGSECVLVDNDLAANQDFVYANRGLLEEDEDDEEDDEEEPGEDEDFVSGKLLRSFMYNVDRAEMVKIAKRFKIAYSGLPHNSLALALIARLPLTAIEALIDGEEVPDDIL